MDEQMTYSTVADIMDSTSMIRRENAAIAKEGIDPPEQWQYEHRWKLAASPGWDAAWDSALASHPDDPDYDPGDDQGVITDGMILSAIQGFIEADKPEILVRPGYVVDELSTYSKLVAEPAEPWTNEQHATFTDGEFQWDGDSWEPYIAIQLPPQLTALEPSSASITDADFEGHIRGQNFTENSVIVWNGADEPTRFIDESDVWTTVVPSVVTAPTVLNVYVRNGDGQVSNILEFTWEA
jgi:hypothetical protein